MNLKRKLPNLNHFDLKGCFIAGGAVLSTVTKSEIADYDVYPKNKDAAITIIEELQSQGVVCNVSDNAVTFKHNTEKNDKGERALIQLIIGEYATPQDVFNRFDFTVCMGTFDCDTNEYEFHECFWPDVTSKTLHFNEGTDYPMNSLIRVSKYHAKGYKIPKGQMIKIAVAIANEGLPQTWKELEQQMGGIYGRQIVLDADDKPCTLENIMEVMENLTVGVLYGEDTTDKYASLTFEEICIICGLDDGVYYQNEEYDDVFTENSDGYFTTVVGLSLGNELIKDKIEFRVLPKTAKFKAYKALYKTDAGDYLPSVRRQNSEVRYQIGETTSMTDKKAGRAYHKGLFVFTNVSAAIKKCTRKEDIVVEIEYKLDDIITSSSYSNEIELKELRVIRIVDKETKSKSEYPKQVFSIFD